MALVLADRVQETTTTTGTGTVTLAGAVSGFQSFSVVGNGNTTYYTIVDSNTGDWEVGLGTYTSSGTTLSRTTVLSSSNSGSLVNFGAGTKQVFVTYPSAMASSSVVGPSTSLDNMIAVFDGTSGKVIQTPQNAGIVRFADPNYYQGYLSPLGMGYFDTTVEVINASGSSNGLKLIPVGGSTGTSVVLQAPTSGGNSVFILPAGTGTNGQALTTNGSGTLSWTTISGGGGMSPVTAAMIWG